MAARLRMFAGPNGSGKSTLYARLKELIPFGYFLNADILEKQLNHAGFLNFQKFGLEVEATESLDS